MRRELSINHLSRVEGHGAVNILFENERLKEIRLRFTEGPRFFEFITRERLYSEIPKIVSRICGICYVSHRLASAFAVEDAFGVKVPKTVELLRRLLVVGEFLESHALHLYFLALPDYMGYPGAIQMAKDYPNIVKRGFRIKEVGNRIMKLIGGKTVHGENILVGGFASVPQKESLERVGNDLRALIPELEATLSLFDSLDYPEFESDVPVSVSLDSRDVTEFSDLVVTSDGERFTRKEYELFVKEEVASYSTAKISKLNGKPFVIGPLARVNLKGGALHPAVREEMSLLKTKFPSKNSFHNNVARAVELLNAAYRGVEIVEELLESDLESFNASVEPVEGTGYGVKEAPRGTLYHRYSFSKDGHCTGANIITPTAQLQSAVEEDLKNLVESYSSVSDRELKKLAEMLVRAYDP